MKFALCLAFLYGCNPEAITDFVQGEEQVLQTVLKDEIPSLNFTVNPPIQPPLQK